MSDKASVKLDADFIEREFIKSILLQPNIIPEVSQIVNSEDFSIKTYRTFYIAMLELYSIKKKLTLYNVFMMIRTMGETYMSEDASIFFEEAPLDHPIDLANLVRLFSVQRQFKKCADSTTYNMDKGDDTLTLLMDAKDRIENLSKRLVDSDDKTYEESIDEVFEEYLSDEEKEFNVIPTPYPTLNTYLNGGFQDGKLITVGARTGVGKTVLATQCTAEACSLGKSVLYFSLEMPKEEIYKRLTACYGNILLNQLKPGSFKTDEIKSRIKKVQEDFKGWDLEVVDKADISMEYISAVSQQKAQSSIGVDLIIIDYLQLISTKSSRKRNRQEEVAEISRACKILSRKLECPVMILVQLNREQKGDDEERIPSKADIRESAAIAADSDVIIIIHRKYRDDSADPKALLILDKNRGGPSDRMIQVRCVLEKNIFQDVKGSQSDGSSPENEDSSNDEWGQVEDLVDDSQDTSDDDYLSDIFSDLDGV